MAPGGRGSIELMGIEHLGHQGPSYTSVRQVLLWDRSGE